MVTSSSTFTATSNGEQAPEQVDCGCIDRVNEMLKPHNTKLELLTTINMKTGRGHSRLSISTVKFDPRKRDKAKYMMPSFCPFCGKKYHREDSDDRVQDREGERVR